MITTDPASVEEEKGEEEDHGEEDHDEEECTASDLEAFIVEVCESPAKWLSFLRRCHCIQTNKNCVSPNRCCVIL